MQELIEKKNANTMQWQRLYTWAKTTQPIGGGGVGSGYIGTAATQFALVYLLTGDPQYAEAAVYYMDMLNTYETVSTETAYPYLRFLSQAYDWMYNYLTSEQRASYLAKIIQWTEQIKGMKQYNGSFGNYSHRFMMAEAITGYAILADNPAKGQEYIDNAIAHWILIKDCFILSAGDGASFMGEDYQNSTMWQTTAQFIELMNFMTDDDYYVGCDFLEKRIQFIIYNLWMGLNGAIPTIKNIRNGDYQAWKVKYESIRLQLLLLGNYYYDTYGKYAYWVINNTDELNSNKTKVMDAYKDLDLIFYDRNKVGTNVSELPTAYYADNVDGVGITIMKSDWSEDQTLIAYICGNWYGSGHQDLDQGSFQIYSHKRELAINSGSYDGDGSSNAARWYFGRTVAQNSLLIYDPNEHWDNCIRGVDDRLAYGNDGGQRDFSGKNAYDKECPQVFSNAPHWETFRQRCEVGDYKAFKHTDDFDYIYSDLTNAYNNPAFTSDPDGTYNYPPNIVKVTKVNRQLVYVRGINEYVVIFDDVVSADASYKKTWLLHMIEQPVLNGDETVIEGTSELGISQSANSDLVTIIEGDRKLFSKTLLPASSVITRIGGVGPQPPSSPHGPDDYDQWLDGSNHYQWGGFYGKWRIEVSPTEANTFDNFLHVLHPASAETLEMPPTELITATGDNMRGTLIGDSVNPTIVMFSKDGSDISEVTYEASYIGDVKHILVNIEEGSYDVYQGDLKIQEGILASEQGTLSFSAQGGGTFHVIVSGKPSIYITSPLDGTSFNSSSITVTGTASDDRGILSVIVNTITATINVDGVWTAKGVELIEGENTIKAKATDTDNNETEKSIKVYLNTATPPAAAFSGTPTSGKEPLTVTFTDSSSNNPTSWLWSFGQGQGTSTLQNPEYVYSAPGLYTVSLTATNEDGSDTMVKTDYIEVTTDDDPPAPPTNLQAEAVSSSQINLNWDASISDDVEGYKIYRDLVEIDTTADTSYQDTGLAPATQYTYQVSAYDEDDNESAKSNSSSATTPPSDGTNTWYVDGAMENDSGNGKSWETAKKYIGSGIGLMSGGDTLLIADGTYTGTKNIIDEVPSGTPGHFTAIKAQNAFNVTLDGLNPNGGGYLGMLDLFVWSSSPIPMKSYIHIDGIFFFRGGASVDKHHHVKITNCGFCEASESSGVTYNLCIARSFFVLVEDCYTFGEGRYKFGLSSGKWWMGNVTTTTGSTTLINSSTSSWDPYILDKGIMVGGDLYTVKEFINDSTVTLDREVPYTYPPQWNGLVSIQQGSDILTNNSTDNPWHDHIGGKGIIINNEQYGIVWISDDSTSDTVRVDKPASQTYTSEPAYIPVYSHVASSDIVFRRCVARFDFFYPNYGEIGCFANYQEKDVHFQNCIALDGLAFITSEGTGSKAFIIPNGCVSTGTQGCIILNNYGTPYLSEGGSAEGIYVEDTVMWDAQQGNYVNSSGGLYMSGDNGKSTFNFITAGNSDSDRGWSHKEESTDWDGKISSTAGSNIITRNPASKDKSIWTDMLNNKPIQFYTGKWEYFTVAAVLGPDTIELDGFAANSSASATCYIYPSSDCNSDIKNSIIYNYNGLGYFGEEGWESKTANSFDSKYNSYYLNVLNGNVSDFDYTDIDPLWKLDTNPGGALKYLVRIEKDSNLDNKGEGGNVPVGATVLNKIGFSGKFSDEPGWNVDTGEPLWPWLNEDKIKVLMGNPGYNAHKDPASEGTATQTSANKLIDSNATFKADGVQIPFLVRNTADSTETYVVSVDSETELTLENDIFVAGKTYEIIPTDLFKHLIDFKRGFCTDELDQWGKPVTLTRYIWQYLGNEIPSDIYGFNANFTAQPTTGTAPLRVEFTDTSSDSAVSWQWDFGDETPISTEQNPVHVYQSVGEYTVTLTVTDQDGLTDTETKTNYIKVTVPTPPVADFTADDTEGEAPFTVNFTDTSTNNPTSWDWDFGDGTPHSTLQNPSHEYTQADQYTVTLTATNSDGSDTEIKIDYITVTTSQDNDPPAPPTNLQAEAVSSSQINLNWDASTSDDVEGYKIYRGDDEIDTTADTSYQDTGLAPATQYTYQVSAYDEDDNESAKSEPPVSATTDPENNILVVWAAGDSDKIQPDTPAQSSNRFWSAQANKISINSAKNEYSAFQLILTAYSDIQDVNVSVSDLTMGSFTIPSLNIELFREYFQFVTTSEGNPGDLPINQYYPDPLIPFGKGGAPFDLPPDLNNQNNANQPVWVDIYVPKDAPAGVYTGTITITGQDINKTVNIELEVWDFQLPDETHLESHSVLYGGNYFGDRGEGLWFYGTNSMTDSVWEVLKQYNQMARKHRLGILNGSQTQAPSCTFDADGNLISCNWQKFDRYFAPILDGSLFIDGSGANTPPNHWEISTPADWTQDTDYNDNAIKTYFAAYVSHIEEYLSSKGIPESRYPHLLYAAYDESGDIDGIVRYATLIQESVGDKVSYLDTRHWDAAGSQPGDDDWPLIGKVDVWCPDALHYNPDSIQPRQKNYGEYGWFYHNSEPYLGHHVVNAPGFSMRIWPLMSYKYKVDGTYIWCVDYWDFYPEPGNPAVNIFNQPNNYPRWGNGVMFYPGNRLNEIGLPSNRGPIPSFRLKAFRRGAQDYEYAYMLKAKGGDPDTLINAVINSGLMITENNSNETGDWSHNANDYYRLREDLANAILGVVPPDNPPIINITSPQEDDTFNTRNITVTGEASDNEGEVTVKVNDTDAVFTDDTHWTVDITLPEGDGDKDITAEATDNNEQTTEKTIKVLLDTTSPFTSDHDPQKGETGVSPDTNIILKINDPTSGVDITTIVMYVQDQRVTPVIEGGTFSYTLTYNPDEDFGYSQEVDVEVRASDLANNPMQDIYSFTTKQQEKDETPPSTTEDLAATSTDDSSIITLSWTAPGDDNDQGTASSYDVRYSHTEIKNKNDWEDATQLDNEPAPKQAGQQETFQVDNLYGQLYFALITSDEVFNESGISNNASIEKLCAPVIESFTVTPATAAADTELALSIQAYDLDGEIIKYEIDYEGTGRYDWHCPVNTGNLSVITTHKYTKPGEYNLLLKVTDNSGLCDIYGVSNVNITPSLQAPSISVTATPSTGTVPLKVNFKITTQDLVKKYLLDFDGDYRCDLATKSVDITKEYTLEGVYNVNVWAQGASGDYGYAQVVVATDTNTAYQLELEASDAQEKKKTKIKVKGNDKNKIKDYRWDPEGNNNYIFKGEDFDEIGKYYQTGTYDVCALVDDGNTSLALKLRLAIEPDEDKGENSPKVGVSCSSDKNTAPIVATFSNALDADNVYIDTDADGINDCFVAAGDTIKRTFYEKAEHIYDCLAVNEEGLLQRKSFLLSIAQQAPCVYFKQPAVNNAVISGNAVSLSVSSNLVDITAENVVFKYRLKAQGEYQPIPKENNRQQDLCVFNVFDTTQIADAEYELIAECNEYSTQPLTVVVDNTTGNDKTIYSNKEADSSFIVKVQTKANTQVYALLPDGSSFSYVPDPEEEADTLIIEGIPKQLLSQRYPDVTPLPGQQGEHYHKVRFLSNKTNIKTGAFLEIIHPDTAKGKLLDIYKLKEGSWVKRIDSITKKDESITIDQADFSLFGLGGLFGGSSSGGGGEGGGGGGGGCFIVTACYGTPQAQEVKILSQFRDNYLLTNPLGTQLVQFYYKHSPKWAEYIKDKAVLKRAIRTLLRPCVWMATRLK
ncbi:MAG: PKD domain-containing protein [Candidatus Omnitrophota bacterium]